MQALSQLSYGPVKGAVLYLSWADCVKRDVLQLANINLDKSGNSKSSTLKEMRATKRTKYSDEQITYA